MSQKAAPEAKDKTPRAASVLWLARINTTLSQWAASQSWARLVVLALLALIAGSMFSETLNLRHDKVSASDKSGPRNRNLAEASGPCAGDELRIGGDQGIVLCHISQEKKAGAALKASVPPSSAPTAPAASTASASATSSVAAAVASAPAQPKRGMIVFDTDEVDVGADGGGAAHNRRSQVIQRTFAGWLGDIFSAALIALFAYFAAAKILMRKTAEANAMLHVADAKVRSAEDTAEREAVERQLMQARLKLLQAQVEPHFLFNTLAAVDYLIETDPPRASVMQKALIDYLRASLPQMRQDSSTLGREVKLVRAYLDLLKMRIEERLDFDIEVSAALECAVFPPMVLQTLVENAIQHGIEPKPGGGRVSVRALHEDGNLRVDVVDTGVGLPANFSSHSTTPSASHAGGSSGLGLDNIRNRLAVLYPHTSRIELSSGYGGGTLVRLTIPFQSASSMDDTAAP